jgi:hypothetical protein
VALPSPPSRAGLTGLPRGSACAQVVLLTSSAAVSAANWLRFLRAEAAIGRWSEPCNSSPFLSKPQSASASDRTRAGGRAAGAAARSEAGVMAGSLVLASTSASQRVAAEAGRGGGRGRACGVPAGQLAARIEGVEKTRCE